MSHRQCRSLVAILFLIAAAHPASAQIVSSRIATGLANPLYATSAPGDPSHLYVAEYGGTVRVVDTTTGAITPSPVLDLAAITGTDFLTSPNQQGLLGLTFNPNFQSNGYFYVHYTYDNGTHGGADRIERYTYNFATGTANPASRQTILEIPQIDVYHNGGWLGFGPKDGLLYINVGDGNGQGNDPGNNAQSTSTLLGKILRIDVNNTSPGLNYAVPSSNPFVNTPGARGEIYAYGLNPWRSSFDRATGNLYIGDVGQGTREEINFIPSGSPGGQNFGWRLREGTIPTPDTPGLPSVGGPRPPGNVDPIYDYPHDGFGNSVTGGYVYRGPTLLDHGKSLDGTYFFGDYFGGRIMSFQYDGSTLTDFRDLTTDLHTAINGGTIDNVASFAEDGFGNLYVVDFDGEIFRITTVPEPGSLALTGVVALAFWLRRKWRRGRSGDADSVVAIALGEPTP